MTLTVVYDKGHGDEILLMLLHHLLSCRSLRLPHTGSRNRGASRIESPLEILHIDPKAEILLAKVDAKKFAEQAPKRRLVQNVFQSCCMTIFGTNILVDCV